MKIIKIVIVLRVMQHKFVPKCHVTISSIIALNLVSLKQLLETWRFCATKMKLWCLKPCSRRCSIITQSVQQAGYWLDDRSWFPGRCRELFANASRQALEPAQPRIQCLQVLPPNGKAAGTWSYTSTPPYVFMARCFEHWGFIFPDTVGIKYLWHVSEVCNNDVSITEDV